MYLTYEEYKNYDDEVTELEFNKLERIARRNIDYHTYNRVKSFEHVPAEVKDCMYDLIDYEYSLLGTDGKEVQSEKTDTYSVDYSMPSKSNVKLDLKAYNIKNIIRENLLHTGLLYKGLHL